MQGSPRLARFNGTSGSAPGARSGLPKEPLIQSRASITTCCIALNKALGGGWNGHVDASTPEVPDAGTGPRLRRSAGAIAGGVASK